MKLDITGQEFDGAKFAKRYNLDPITDFWVEPFQPSRRDPKDPNGKPVPSGKLKWILFYPDHIGPEPVLEPPSPSPQGSRMKTLLEKVKSQSLTGAEKDEALKFLLERQLGG